MYEQLKKYIEESNNIVFFGGAGVSTESGIPDFRSKNGLYNQHDIQFDKYEPEYLLSRECLYHNPKVFYEFYRQKMDMILKLRIYIHLLNYMELSFQNYMKEN